MKQNRVTISQRRSGTKAGGTSLQLLRLLSFPLLLPLSLLSLMLLSSCSNHPRAADSAAASEIRDAIEAVLHGGQAEDAYDALLKLAGRYPDSALPSLSLARVALDLGRPNRARTYLKRAEALRGAAHSATASATNLDVAEISSELAYVEGRFGEAADYARRAVAAGGGDRSRLLLARSSAQSGDSATAVESYRAVLHTLDLNDYGAYATALQATGRADEALAVLGLRQQRHGYQPGQGVQESMLYSSMERPAYVAAAALMDVEYLRYHKGMPDAEVERNIQFALASLDPVDSLAEVDAAQQQATRLLLQGYAAFIDGRWQDAVLLLEPASDGVRHPFVDYLLLVAGLHLAPVRSGNEVPQQLNEYVKLEPLFVTFQPYYYHLWQALKRLTTGYSILTSRELLERAILLAPGSAAGVETRRELGRLIGLNAAEADLLLLGDEVEALSRAILTYRDPRLLETFLDSLSLRETEYTLGLMIALQRLATVGPLRDYLLDALSVAEGDLRQRLSLVLDVHGRDSER